jgi:hypothetical protein
VTDPGNKDERERHNRWTALGIRTDIPHPARVYDFILGGKDNFAADREMAEVGLKLMPEMRESSLGNRAFLVRAVRFMRDAGVRQFLDIGTGLPTSPNTCEVAQDGHPDSRVVYVDNDPIVVRHAGAWMADNENIAVVPADLRDVDEVLSRAGRLLDFSQPVGLMFVAVLHNIADADEFAQERVRAASRAATERGATWLPRSKDAIGGMFGGRELLDPGLVLVSHWRPEGGVPDPGADRAWTYCGVARV